LLPIPDAADVFRRHEILLTGANGFLGKVLLGMLIDRFPDLKHLHVLMRPKGALNARDRFAKDVLGSPALKPVLAKAPAGWAAAKITVLGGDIGEERCGLSEEDTASLAGVRLIINCAGLVEFFPPVDESFRSNVDGVERVVALAKRLGAKLVHVSTCYVCGPADGVVEETDPVPGFYPRRRGPRDNAFDHRAEIASTRARIREIRESGCPPGAAADRLTELGRLRSSHWGWVNTYTYAKSIGEQIVVSEPEVEHAIVRPAIVESALDFPFPGWVEGGRTAAPLVLMAMGGLRHWTIRKDAPLEVVPVDFVASSILAVSTLLMHGRHEQVYQLGTADVNPLLLEPLVELLHAEAGRRRRRPLARPVRIVTAQRARERRLSLQRRIKRAQSVLFAVKKTLEAAGLPGRRPISRMAAALRLLDLQSLFREQTLELYQPFILHNRFVFESENIRAAYRQLSQKDRELLPWTPETIDWRTYWVHHQIEGIEKWVQQDSVKDFRFKV
jgi:long-chain acyl-CoA synthetase